MSDTSTLRDLRSYPAESNADYLDMRLRKLVSLILSCLVLTALVAPVASAHNDRRDNGRGERSHDGNPGRGHGRDKDRGHGRDKDRGRDRGKRGEASFFGAPGRASCSRDPWECNFIFSRSVTERLLERLNWVLTDHIEYARKMATRLCRRAQKANECAGSFVAGLWNGVDELTLAVQENTCATVRLQWSKVDGLAQTWARTSESCTD